MKEKLVADSKTTGKPCVYARNEPQFWQFVHLLWKEAGVYGKRLLLYVMGWPESLDIDTSADLQLAGFFLRRG